jgi:hypothetical protein
METSFTSIGLALTKTGKSVREGLVVLATIALEILDKTPKIR